MAVVGGNETRPGNWPWQVALIDSYGIFYCGGTLISPNWVLTAAHCIAGIDHVRLGDHHLYIDEGHEQDVAVKSTYVYPGYLPMNNYYDIALVELSNTVTVNSHVNVACLPTSGRDPSEGDLCYVAGWGKTDEGHPIGSFKLREAVLPIAAQADCSRMYAGHADITDDFICAGYLVGGVDTCDGDSGGPLMKEDGGVWTVYGVTNFGDGCALPGNYGVYARVSSYMNWITQTLNGT
uniref:Plasminogen-like n=1 Tax=Saccoglossus kowalevskii TaxID=10224 RepID=A0ABM0M9J7_SACKO|nr:PREDICTED: plasminogen-like [Saccoglossus kowalevskii]